MPPHSISINTPTNAKIRQIVQNLEQSYTPEPDKFIFGGGSVREYARSGSNGTCRGRWKKNEKVGKILKQSAKGFNDVMGPVASIAKTVAPLAPLLLALGEGDMETKKPKGSVCRKSQKSATWMQKSPKGSECQSPRWEVVDMSVVK